jgi:hypothetical protein
MKLFTAFHQGRYVVVIQIGNEKIGLLPAKAQEAINALTELVKDCRYQATMDKDLKGDFERQKDNG